MIILSYIKYVTINKFIIYTENTLENYFIKKIKLNDNA